MGLAIANCHAKLGNRFARINATFLNLLIDPSLLPVGVGLGLGDPGAVRVASKKSPSFDATQHLSH